MAKKATETKKHIVRCAVEVQHNFELTEYKSKSEELAQILADVALKEEAVKAAAASAKAAIKELESKASELANQLRLGVEPRTVQADCEFDRKTGTKTFRFADGKDKGKVIKKEAMSESEFEMLPISDIPKEEAKEEAKKGGEPAPGDPLAQPVLTPEQAEE